MAPFQNRVDKSRRRNSEKQFPTIPWWEPPIVPGPPCCGALWSTLEAHAPVAARDGPRLENELDEPTKSAKEDDATQSTKEATRVLKYKRKQHKKATFSLPRSLRNT